MKIAIVVVAILLATTFTVGTAKAAPAVPKNATTTNNVCLVYSINGVYSGGIAINSPNTVSYKTQDGHIFLWLPGMERIRVDTLAVSPLPLPPDVCVGIV